MSGELELEHGVEMSLTFEDIAESFPNELEQMQPRQLDALKQVMRNVEESRQDATVDSSCYDSDSNSESTSLNVGGNLNLKILRVFKDKNLLKFVVSSSINLILPFINGLMLGFGELVAHEICWRHNWFNRRNIAAFKIYPESRKVVGLNKHNQQNISDDNIQTVL